MPGSMGEGFMALVELSPDAVFVIADGYHVLANARGIALLGGATLADLRTRPAIEFMHREIRDVAQDRMATMTDGRTALDYVEEQVVRLDGRVVDIEAAGTPITYEGAPAALVVVRDITARKQAEEALRAAQSRFTAAFRHAPTGMAILDSGGAVLDANPALAALLARPPAQLLGRPAWALVHEADAEAARRLLRALLRRGDATVRTQLRYARAGGAPGWLDLCAAPLAGSGSFVLHALDVSDQRAAQAALAHQARHDPLTGLANRRAVLEHLDQALARAAPGGPAVGLLFVDLDGFKAVNDAHGHAAGDTLLRVVAARLAGCVRPGDLVGRLGGDEFTVVAVGVGEAGAGELAGRVEAALLAPVAFDDDDDDDGSGGRDGGGAALRVGVSIGVATSAELAEGEAGAGGGGAERLLGLGDRRMYAVKARHRAGAPR